MFWFQKKIKSHVKIFLLLNFIILPYSFLLQASLSTNTNISNMFYTDQANNDWTVGTEVGKKRILTVTDCSGICLGLTPIGTNITHEITSINETHIKYNRSVSYPNSFHEVPAFEIEGTFTLPRIGYEIFPPNPSLSHPLTTNNTELLKKNLKLDPSRNISIEHETSFQIEIKEKFFHEDHYDDYLVTFDKATGWVFNFDNIIYNKYGIEQGHVKENVLFEVGSSQNQPTTTTPILEMILGIFIIFLTLVLASIIFIFKIRKEDYNNIPLSLLLEDRHKQFLKRLYTKLIQGLANYSTFLLNQDQKIYVEDFKKLNTSLVNKKGFITDLYPEDIRHELSSDIRGRSIMILVELAYQPLENKYQSFLSKTLDIPPQTVVFELKRLLDLKYLKYHQDINTLKDTRFKYYELTEKGLTFLHLLKETIAFSMVLGQTDL